MLSSIAAIQDTTVRPPITFTEKDWNDHSERVIREQGQHAHPGEKCMLALAVFQLMSSFTEPYCCIDRASKALAEKAAWKFYEDTKPKWDMVAINPALVMGPIIRESLFELLYSFMVLILCLAKR